MAISLNDLPKSELLTLALKDLALCSQDARYEINMSAWHESRGGTCYVCLAGSVMAQTLAMSPYVSSSPTLCVTYEADGDSLYFLSNVALSSASGLPFCGGKVSEHLPEFFALVLQRSMMEQEEEQGLCTAWTTLPAPREEHPAAEAKEQPAGPCLEEVSAMLTAEGTDPPDSVADPALVASVVVEPVVGDPGDIDLAPTDDEAAEPWDAAVISDEPGRDEDSVSVDPDVAICEELSLAVR